MAGKARNPLVCLVGTFPPPVHGMAQVNEFMRQRVASATPNVAVFNTAAPALDRRLWMRAQRIVRAGSTLIAFAYQLASNRRAAHVYLGVSGGWGQLLDCCFAALARLFHGRVWAHHHSFAYIDRPGRLTALLIGLLGKNAVHIVLCEKMASGLSRAYRLAAPTIVLSNAAFLAYPTQQASRVISRPIRVGYLSNITLAKGIGLYAEVTNAFENSNEFEFIIAGPVAEPAAQQHLDKVAALKNVQYIGPVFRDAKLAFLAGLDVLLFPSKYENEAEPLVVLEAMSHGIAVVSTNRGCLDCIAVNGGNVAVHESKFAQTAIDQLLAWRGNESLLAEAKSASAVGFTKLAQANREKLDTLIADLVGSQGLKHA
jgi:glycosyltransferase involved in cell wall biosynthesis